MIDIHSHILHGLDDGPETIEESLTLCRAAVNDGITAIVATPHSMNGKFFNDAGAIIEKVSELNAALEQNNIKLKVYPGADLHIYPSIVKDIEEGRALTYNNSKKYVLREFPFQSVPAMALDILRGLMKAGIIPIVSHPERNEQILRNFEFLEDMKNQGALLQVTAMSVTGGFGGKIQGFSLKMLKSGLVDVIATDAHSIDRRPPQLSQAAKSAAELVGAESAASMVEELPRRILGI